jgi:hypothetical protein
MSYLTVLEKELLESLAHIQPLKVEGKPAKTIVMSYHTYEFRLWFVDEVGRSVFSY